MSGATTKEERVEDGGPAAYDPLLKIDVKEGRVISSKVLDAGMSLRDWFAGRALAVVWGSLPCDNVKPEDVADEAYKIADAMLARGKR